MDRSKLLSSLLTTFSSCALSFFCHLPAGMLMVCIVIGARKLGVNPDNIATPIAASLGDLITLSILAFVSSFFYKHKGKRYPLRWGTRTRLGPMSANSKLSHPLRSADKFSLHLRAGVCKETREGQRMAWPLQCALIGGLTDPPWVRHVSHQTHTNPLRRDSQGGMS